MKSKLLTIALLILLFGIAFSEPKLSAKEALYANTLLLINDMAPLKCPVIVANVLPPPKDYTPGLLTTSKAPCILTGDSTCMENVFSIHQAFLFEITSGYPKAPNIDLLKSAPFLCDVIVYYYPRMADYSLPPYTPSSIPQGIPTPSIDFIKEIAEKRRHIASLEYQTMARIIQKANAISETFYGSVKAYVFELTIEKAGKEGKLQVDMQKLLNNYAWLLYNLRINNNTEAIRTLLWTFLTGYRQRGVEYPQEPIQIALQNLEIISSWKLAHYPAYSFLNNEKTIDLWVNSQGRPDINPFIKGFIGSPIIQVSTPLSVLDQPVFLQMFLTHDFSQNTPFTDFVLYLTRGNYLSGEMPELTYDRERLYALAKILNEKLQPVLNRDERQEALNNAKRKAREMEERLKGLRK